ncbi:MAG: hypothetical protein LC792_26600, partial [Actinobacteria bacterium]|nr:hypothetical protein [Actinomycetota bacterium]
AAQVPRTAQATSTDEADLRLAPAAVTHAFSNDDFADAYRVPAVPFTARTDTSSATSQPGEPRSCAALGGRTAWYRFTPTRDIGLLADTFGTQRPTAVTVYTGRTLTALHREGECSSDARGNALVAFAAKARTTYYFQVDQAVGGEAVFTLQQQGVTTRASVTSDGREGNGVSLMGVISADGRRVAMLSGSALGAEESTEPCTQLPPGALAPCGKASLYLRDRARHVTTNQNPAQTVGAPRHLGSLVVPGSLSRDGRYQVFWATVSVTAPEAGPNRASPYRFEVFRLDNRTHRPERVSVPCPGCGSGPNRDDTDRSSGRAEISADGRYVAFISWASNITHDSRADVRGVYVRDMVRGVTTRVDVPSDRDRAALGEPDDATSERSAYGTGDQGSDLFSISGDGRYVVFKSASSNLVWGDHNGHSDAFVRDRRAGTTVRVNVSSSGAEANADTRSVLGLGLHTISDDGRYVLFNSDATNVVSPPTADGVENLYRRDLRTGVTTLVTVSSSGEPAAKGVDNDYIRLPFTYLAPLLFAGGTNVAL